MYGNRRQAFSLLELLITLTIIAILVCIALPSYRSSLVQAHRADGKIGLYQLAAQLEKSGSPMILNSPEGYYRLAVIKNNPDYFLVAAIPIKSQAQDKSCNVLAMDSLGNRGVLRGESIISQAGCW